MKKLFTLALCLFSTISLCAQTQVVAHQGFHKNIPGNSVESFRRAQEMNFYGSECDFNMTADGVVVALHGPTHGKYNIHETDYATLNTQKLSNGEPVPTLDDMLIQAKKNTNTKLIIEIKNHPTAQMETKIVKKILAAVKKYKLQDHVEYIAFRQHVCNELVKYGPKGIKVAHLSGDTDDSLPPQYCKSLGYTGIDYHINTIKRKPEWIKQSHDLGLTVNVWTLWDAPTMQWLIDQGVDFITTEEPMVLNGLLGK